MAQEPIPTVAAFRAKYPGAYDDMSDTQLQAAIARKFSGQRQPEQPAVAPPPTQADSDGVSLMDVSPSLRAARDAAGGVRAGFARAVFGGGDLMRQATGQERVIERPEVQDAMTPPESMAGRTGYAVEQAAEFIYPLSKIGTAMRALPQMAIRLGGRSIPTTTALRAGAEGAASGGIAAVQGGDPVWGSIAGAAGPVLGRGLESPIGQRVSQALRDGAEKRVAQALGATKERFKAMAGRLAPQMLDRGVPGRLGASREGLLEQAREQARSYGRAIDGALSGAGDDVINTSLIVDALEEAKAGFQTTRRMTIQEATRRGLTERARDAGDGMVDIVTALDDRPIEQLTKLQQTIAQLGDDATVNQIVAARRVWDDVVARAGGHAHRSNAAFGVPLAEQTEAWAKKQATDAIRRVLSEANPDLASLNKEFSFWKGLQDVLTATQRRTQAQSAGVGQAIASGAGAVAGAASGDNMQDRIQNMVIGGLVGKQLRATVTSPRWRFVSADVRNRLAGAIASGRESEVLGALVRVTAAMQGGAMRPVPSH